MEKVIMAVIEFLLSCDLIELLFSEIFDYFADYKLLSIFLNSLEVYIEKKMIDYIPTKKM